MPVTLPWLISDSKILKARGFLSKHMSIYRPYEPFKPAEDPREVPGYGFSAGTEPASSGGGLLGAIDKVAGLIAPILERAVAYKRGGFPGYNFPGREGGSRMGGDYFIQYLDQMRQRNEMEAERARQEREAARKSDMRQQIILEGLKAGKFTYEDALKALESDEFKLGAPAEAGRPSPQAPATAKP